MSTQTDVKSTTETEVKSEAQLVLEDTTIVSDKVLMKLMTQVDNHQLKVGGKWADLIQHCIDTWHFYGVAEADKENKEVVAANKAEIAAGKKIILKTLLEMGKTESTAYSVRSYIVKMAKEENKETLAKLKAGDITVRASREAGRKPQSNPSKSNETKYQEALNSAVRYAVALNLTRGKFADDAEAAFKQYYADNPDKVEPSILKA